MVFKRLSSQNSINIPSGFSATVNTLEATSEIAHLKNVYSFSDSVTNMLIIAK